MLSKHPFKLTEGYLPGHPRDEGGGEGHQDQGVQWAGRDLDKSRTVKKVLVDDDEDDVDGDRDSEDLQRPCEEQGQCVYEKENLIGGLILFCQAKNKEGLVKMTVSNGLMKNNFSYATVMTMSSEVGLLKIH